MYAGQKHLDNLCVMVDRNNGQLDMANRMVFPMPELERVFASFDWQVHQVDATQYDGVYAALEAFRYRPRNGKPTAIICHGMKGHGALSDLLNRHKVTVPDAVIEQELTLQGAQRRDRVEEFNEFYRSLGDLPDGSALQDTLRESAGRMHLDAARGPAGALSLTLDDGARPDRACADASQAGSVRRRAAAASRSIPPVRGQRHRHGGHEGLCARTRRWSRSIRTWRRRAASRPGSPLSISGER